MDASTQLARGCLGVEVILWLDDIRPPWQHGFIGATWSKTAQEAMALLATGSVVFASLDHDLSEEATMGQPKPGELTGYSVVCFLEENPHLWPPKGVRVHSLNPSGKQRMLQVIEKHYGRRFE